MTSRSPACSRSSTSRFSPGFAFVDETAWLLHRYQTSMSYLESTASLSFTAPRRFAEVVKSDVIIGAARTDPVGGGSMLVHPQAVLEAFLDFDADGPGPGYGFPR